MVDIVLLAPFRTMQAALLLIPSVLPGFFEASARACAREMQPNAQKEWTGHDRYLEGAVGSVSL